MQTVKIAIFVTLSLIWGSCSTSRQASQAEHAPKANFSFQLGTNKGGMVENTDMSVIEGIAIDAFSGATRQGINAAARISYPLIGRIYAEAGIDYMNNGQTFTWKDPISAFEGTRRFSTNQLMIPTTLNISLFRRNHRDGLLQLKLGHLLQYNMIRLKEETGALPSYSTNNFSNGMTFGITIIPITLNTGSRIGFFLEAYRGSRIYSDFYNQESFPMPGSAFIKYGIVYRFD